MGVVEEFAKKLKDLRVKNGMSLSDLAEKLEVTAQSLSFYERGMRTVDINLLEKITRVFGVSADYMLGLSEAFSLNTDIQSICNYTGLTEKSVEEIAHDIAIFSDQKNSQNYFKDKNFRVLKTVERDRAKIYNRIIEKGYLRILADEIYDLETKTNEISENYCIDWIVAPNNACSVMAQTLGISELAAVHCAEMAIFMKKGSCSELDLLSFEDAENKANEDYSDLKRYRITKTIEKLCDLFDHRNDYLTYSQKKWCAYLGLTAQEIKLISEESENLNYNNCKTVTEIKEQQTKNIEHLYNKIIELRKEKQ